MLERDPRVLLRMQTWLRLTKLGAVLVVETATVPAVLAAMRVSDDPTRVLELQSRFRQWALGWIYPEIRHPD